MNTKEILYKLIDGSASDVEKDDFSKWVATLSLEAYNQLLLEYEFIIAASKNVHHTVDKNLLQNIHQQIEKENTETKHQNYSIKKLKSWNIIRIAAAAVLFSAVAYGVWMYVSDKERNSRDIAVLTTSKQIIEPRGNKAVLTLADGSQVILDSAGSGAITTQGNVKVIKLTDGQLSYQPSGNLVATELQYNTITTPRGGQYQITLSDGSKVWLNAESSLRYPAVFSVNERSVELTGEGYFEVAHSASKPFSVKHNRVSVQVLGTHFNVNAYSEESATKITLVEGAVKVQDGKSTVFLKPAEQAVADGKGNLAVIKGVDLKEVISWKEGYYIFKGSTLSQIVKGLSRWYDIPIHIENTANESLIYTAIVYKSETLDKFMKRLEKSYSLKCVRIGNAYYIR